MKRGSRHFLLLVLILLLAVTATTFAQVSTGRLRGQVTDPSGAVVPGAIVSARTAAGATATATSNGLGNYEIKGLAPGQYTVTALAKGFAASELPYVQITAGQAQSLDIQMGIVVQQQEVMVQEESNSVSTDASNNVGAIVLKDKDLNSLSDDPSELLQDLQALAGPSAGPNGGQIYIDGFTGGQLPPKASIREIRINQNPFSAQYDKLGLGRIEVFTKPGSDKFHGQASFNFNSSVLNSRNPFAPRPPGYHTEQFSGNLSGPITKKSSFFFNAEQRDINEASVINAFVLDPSFNPAPFTQAILSPRKRTSFSARFDGQLTANNTVSARFQLNHADDKNSGIGLFSLPSQAYNGSSSEENVQFSDTQILSPKLINETRLQYIRSHNRERALDFSPTVTVLGAFVGGGNRLGAAAIDTARYELQNYTSASVGKHFVKFGGKLRAVTLASQSTGNFNGTYTFSSLEAYRVTQMGIQNGLMPAQIRAAGGGASQYSVVLGNPLASESGVDVGLYAEDDWKVRPNLTFSYGLRFESQNNIYDHADFAPRVGIAWGIGHAQGTPKTVLRGGFGIFYDRFSDDLVLQTARFNGANEQQIVTTSPDFFSNAPPPGALKGSQSSPTIYRLDPRLRSPYVMQGALTLERQLSKSSTLAVTYLTSRGIHQFLSLNINAPLPGTFDPAVPGSGVRPLGGTTNIYQYESEGLFKQKQLIVNMNTRLGTKLSLFGFYSLGFADSNTSGASSFASNQYDLSPDYGRSAFDVRNRVFIGGSISLPYSIRLSPFIIANSGPPFNITAGRDLNGDSIFNDRPAFAVNPSAPGVIPTRYGFLDASPAAVGNPIPVNYGNGPGQFTFNLRAGKTFGFGKPVDVARGDLGGRPGGGGGFGGFGGGRGGPGGGPGGMIGLGGRGGGEGDRGAASNHRYNLTFNVSARNLFNNVNPAAPVGNLNSPLFGRSNALAGGPFGSASANRRVELQLQFSF